MKKLTCKLTLTVILLFTGIITSVTGQVTVTGHITAEVVESAHASSQIITGSELKGEGMNINYLQLEASKGREVYNLGAVTINAGEDVAFGINLQESVLSDNNGNLFTIEPASVSSGLSDSLHIDGSHKLMLNGTSYIAQNTSSGHYRGDINVVVQYN